MSDLIERIEKAQEWINRCLDLPITESRHNITSFRILVRTIELFNILTDCLIALSPRPLDDAELEVQYKEAINQIESYMSGKRDYSMGFICNTLTTLRDTLAKREGEIDNLWGRVKQAELSLKQTDEWVDILFGELTETVKGGQMTNEQNLSGRMPNPSHYHRA